MLSQAATLFKTATQITQELADETQSAFIKRDALDLSQVFSVRIATHRLPTKRSRSEHKPKTSEWLSVESRV